MTAPLTIIIPTRNSGDYLSQCLQSIEKQSFRHYEVLVIDANSTDDTKSIINNAQCNIRVVNQCGCGLAAAWNQGILDCQSEFIGFLDSDDWWEPNCLLHHMTALQQNTDLSYSIGNVKYVAENPEALPYGFKPSLLNGIHQALMPGCFIGKRQLFEKIGLFPEDLSVATDLQWFHDLKMSQLPSIHLDTHVLNKRVHGSNLSYTTSETATYNKELLKVLHRRVKISHHEQE